MINLTSADILVRADKLLGQAAHQINQKQGASPDDVVQLLRAKEQASAGVHVFHTEDDLNKKILDILA